MAVKQPWKSLTVRGRFWARHLQRWKQSGLSQAQYCRQQQLSTPAFGWWKRHLTAIPTRGHPATTRRRARGKDRSFVELTRADSGVLAPADEGAYEIVLPGGRQLRLGRHWEPDRVRQLLRLLEGGC
jgi:hypothetical protein